MASRYDAEALNAETDRIIREREHEERETAEIYRRQMSDEDLSAVQTSARLLDGYDGKLEWSYACLRNWNERNRGFMNASAAGVAEQVLWLGALIGIAVIDTLVLSFAGREIAKGFAEYLRSSVGEVAWIVPISTFLFALSYLLVELCTGNKTNIRSGAATDSRISSFAVLMWLVLPIFVVGFSLINSGVFSSDPTRVGTATFNAGIFRAVGLGLIALVTHGFVLWFGGNIVTAFGYSLFKLKQFWIRHRINRLDRLSNQARTTVETRFRGFYNSVNSENPNADGPPPKVGPFGSTTASVVNDVFDDDIIEVSQGRAASRSRSSQSDDKGNRRAQSSTDHADHNGKDHSNNKRKESRPDANLGFEFGPESEERVDSKIDPETTEEDPTYDIDGEDEVRAN